MISVIIITKNEAHNIKDCLTSVSWAEEIIVVDSGSTDGTPDICRQFSNCRVIDTDWPGFGPQKNRALSYATQDWVLSLDADERVTNELKADLLATMTQPEHDGYEIPRRSQYCGRFIDHAGWYPDHVLRLFKRNTAQFSNDQVHEKVILNGSVAKLNQPLLHYSFENLEQVLHKVDHYSSLGAKQLYQKGKRASIGKAVYKGIWSFIRTYFLRLGILDGQEGLMLSISNAEGTYYKYAKLALLCKKRGPNGP